jgi:L-ribulokinase
MGHKWMWNPRWGGCRRNRSFLKSILSLTASRKASLARSHFRRILPGICRRMGRLMGLRAGIPIPVGAFDAHWDAIGAGCREGDVVNVVGTSTCIIAMAKETRS